MSSDSVRRSKAFNAEYRTIAEDCLRKAQTVENDDERPFWLNLAQSWLQLAQHSTRRRADIESEKPPVD
jgi:putative IMPACT (imprinted ancient) family translation regulator